MRKKYRDQCKAFLLLIVPTVIFLAAGLTAFLLWEDHEREEKDSRYETVNPWEAEQRQEVFFTLENVESKWEIYAERA